jgi:hypothetical protein
MGGLQMVRRSTSFKSSWHVATAAEAVAAAQFTRLGFNVAVQYGANQPEYDLMIAYDDEMLKISVKGSADGAWGLTQSRLSNANYHAAAEEWFALHKPHTILCFVQFAGVEFDAMPRIYLARPYEVMARLKDAAGGRGDTVLFENHTRGPRAKGAGNTERIPDSWRLSIDRIAEVMKEAAAT